MEFQLLLNAPYLSSCRPTSHYLSIMQNCVGCPWYLVCDNRIDRCDYLDRLGRHTTTEYILKKLIVHVEIHDFSKSTNYHFG